MSRRAFKKRNLGFAININLGNYYDQISNGYEELHKQEQTNKLRIAKGMLNLNRDDWLLDVGAGTGISTEIFDCRITLLDSSKRLLDIARKRVNIVKNKGKVEFVLADAENMPFRDKTFDAAICITSIHNFSNPSKALEEIMRVTKNRKENIVISVLKKSRKREIIIGLLESYFKVRKVIDEKNDLIFLLESIK